MTDAKPRDLTPEDLAQIEAPPVVGTQSAPLRIPPGTKVAIELLNPAAADVTSAASPSAGPNEAVGSKGSSTAPSAPARKKPSAR